MQNECSEAFICLQAPATSTDLFGGPAAFLAPAEPDFPSLQNLQDLALMGFSNHKRCHTKKYCFIMFGFKTPKIVLKKNYNFLFLCLFDSEHINFFFLWKLTFVTCPITTLFSEKQYIYIFLNIKS